MFVQRHDPTGASGFEALTLSDLTRADEPTGVASFDGVDRAESSGVGRLPPDLGIGSDPWDPHPNLREFRAEAARTFAHEPLPAWADPTTVAQRMRDLIGFLEAKRDHAAHRAWVDPSSTSGTAAANQRSKYFSDLCGAMQDDLAHLAGWEGLPLSAQIESFNLIAREANVEIRHNNNIGYVDKRWNDDELVQLDSALARIPDHLLLENGRNNHISRISQIDSNGAGDNEVSTGNIRITDRSMVGMSRFSSAAAAGVTAFTDIVLHEVAHNMDDEHARFAEYSAISGWRRIGDGGSYRHLPNGGEVKGWQVGLHDDPDGDYIVMNQSNRGSYVYRKGAEFGESLYGRTNPHEDFAETFTEFLLAPEALRLAAPTKYDFMNGFAGRPSQLSNATGLIDNLGEFFRVRG
ncbi:MAG TPA: hypothetical protein VGF45_00415 [Polyangia bacterium]